MDFLRKHWYDIGGFLSIFVFAHILIHHEHLSRYQIVTWSSLLTLFLHQLEEYRMPGTFPGMLNTVLYHSAKPDRYPLNTNTAFIVNVVIGWTLYCVAAVLAEKAVWLGIATILVSTGNIIAHTFLFNIKGKTVYNAGLLTALLLFVPCVYFFFYIIHADNLVATGDYLIGVPLGIFVNVFGVLKLIDWMADKNSSHVFERRNLLSKDRVGDEAV